MEIDAQSIAFKAVNLLHPVVVLTKEGEKVWNHGKSRHGILVGVSKDMKFLRVRLFHHKSICNYHPAYWDIDPLQTDEISNSEPWR